MRTRIDQLITVTVLVLAATVASCKRNGSSPTTKPTQPPSGTTALKVVKFANLPYADHTYSSIGVAKGWFKDVGIDLKSETIKIEEVVPGLTSGAYDVASVPPGILFSAYDAAPTLRTFVFGDLFQGYALMGQPRQGYKTYANFVKDGMSPAESERAVVQQMKGKTFAYPTETAIKPFIDLLLERGGLTRDSIKPLVLDDPLTVQAMRTRRSDFQVGGVPSRISLEKEGFVPLITSADLAKGARPSPESKELASILQNGWAMTSEMYDKDRATALRLASVNYRIMSFMQTNRDEALAIHMAYLSKVTGQKFTSEDGRVIYDSLDPFITFDNQRPWFHDSNNPLYYRHVNGAILKSFVDGKIYKGQPPAVDDVILADDTYAELERLKVSSSALLAELKAKAPAASSNASAKLSAAQNCFDTYNYYDADRIAAEAIRELNAKP